MLKRFALSHGSVIILPLEFKGGKFSCLDLLIRDLKVFHQSLDEVVFELILEVNLSVLSRFNCFKILTLSLRSFLNFLQASGILCRFANLCAHLRLRIAFLSAFVTQGGSEGRMVTTLLGIADSQNSNILFVKFSA